MMASAKVEDQNNTADKLNQAKSFKNEGNEQYKKKNYKNAIRNYHKALLYLKGVGASNPFSQLTGEQEPILPPEVQEEVTKLKSDCYNNLAACLLLQPEPNFQKVVEYCSSVLEASPHNVKALYRQGTAYFHLKNFDSAMQALSRACSLPGGDTDTKIRHQLQLCEREIAKQDQKMKQVYKGMFDKMASDTKDVT
ncbi:tetratricopeptide repeat protein 9C [Lingula anatina]|uniref:peptidylprolyl isomerase n=1 Tax=Lingula anatina TaxID=7574 RepID=A0A1S3JBH5_LINAN|nr:tetratricopeptide repeat protein 9C [Lingula anatina]|eukprot:XP_013407752.1 tetratricopeptide repeat protein 9C [Lingula anatina]